MRCAHCEHEIALWKHPTVRLDGGLRCPSCHRVFYAISPMETKHPFTMIMRFAAYGILAVVLMIASLTALVLLRRNGLSFQWMWFALPVAILLFVLFFVEFRTAIRRAATVTELPMYLLKRRRLFGFGYLLLLLANIIYIAAYTSGILPGLAILVQMLGFFGFLVCVIAGYSWHPAHAPNPLED